jgi:RNA polymerase sigma-70 factor (ECF subfamily)
VTEAEVIRRASDGDAQAMRVLYERYAALVFAVVRRFADDNESARDWEQEAWVSAFRGLGEFRGGSELSSWLHRVAVNAALQGRRREARHSRHRDAMETADVERVCADGDTDDRILQRIELEQALLRMPARMKEILLLHDVEGFRHEEIALQLNITDGASRSQLFKARVRLRALLKS